MNTLDSANPSHLTSPYASFLSREHLLPEVLQHTLRSGARHLTVHQQGHTLVFQHDGAGLPDPHGLLPNGLFWEQLSLEQRCFLALAHPQNTARLTVVSSGWQLTLAGDVLQVGASGVPCGVRIEVEGFNLCLNLTEQLARAAAFMPFEVTVAGNRLDPPSLLHGCHTFQFEQGQVRFSLSGIGAHHHLGDTHGVILQGKLQAGVLLGRAVLKTTRSSLVKQLLRSGLLLVEPDERVLGGCPETLWVNSPAFQDFVGALMPQLELQLALVLSEHLGVLPEVLYESDFYQRSTLLAGADDPQAWMQAHLEDLGYQRCEVLSTDWSWAVPEEGDSKELACDFGFLYALGPVHFAESAPAHTWNALHLAGIAGFERPACCLYTRPAGDGFWQDPLQFVVGLSPRPVHRNNGLHELIQHLQEGTPELQQRLLYLLASVDDERCCYVYDDEFDHQQYRVRVLSDLAEQIGNAQLQLHMEQEYACQVTLRATQLSLWHLRHVQQLPGLPLEWGQRVQTALDALAGLAESGKQV